MKTNGAPSRVDMSEYIARLKAASETLQSALSSEDKDFDEQSVETIENASTTIKKISALCESISEGKYAANTFDSLSTLSNELLKLNVNLSLNQWFHSIVSDGGILLISKCNEKIADSKSCVVEILEKVTPLRAMISYRETRENKIMQRIATASGLIIIVIEIVQLIQQ